MCATSSNRGFTLIEILIAVTLLAVISAALYGSYFTVLRARERASDGMESRRELISTLDLMRREISSTYFRRGEKNLRLVVEDRDHFGLPASTLELTTLVSPTGQSGRESGVIAVRYRMTELARRRILVRRERDLFDESADSIEYPQMERINSILVECYDGSKWVRSWDTSLNGTLPAMVRITVGYEEDGKQQSFTMLSTPRITVS